MSSPRYDKRTEALWEGIDLATKTFCRRLKDECGWDPSFATAARRWFVTCRDAGLPTGLDADLCEARMAKHLEDQLRATAYPGLVKKGLRHFGDLRAGLAIYALAAQPQYGLRTKPVPDSIMPRVSRWPVSIEEVRSHLSASDRSSMELIEEHLTASAKKQWSGMGAPMVRGADGRKHKATVSVTNAEMIPRTVWAFLRHGYLEGWKPFTLKGLLTPERITNFLYHSSCVDGSGLQLNTVRIREQQLLDFFYRGRNVRPSPVVVITPELEKKIRHAMAEEQEHRDEWNLAPAKESNTGKHKWYPELEEVRLAERALLEQIDRAEERHDRGGSSDLKFWQEVRDAVLTLCTMYCMWRVDTAATGSLLQLRRDPVSGAVVDEEGFIVIENIARAKNPACDWYPFVPELVIPPNAVRLIEKLLAIEGRSLTKPLRSGESAVHLSAANHDRWGKDVLPDGELTVVPIFRRRRDAPEPLSHHAIQGILDRQLQALHFGATNPHTLRATGAIYWTFIREMPEDLVMTLGLWEDAKTLRKHYAHLHQRDRRARMARYMPPASGIVPPKSRGKREEAAAGALASLGKMLEKTTNPYEARVLLAELRQQCEKIDQTIAAELGVTWEAFRPDRFEPGEVERIDAALRGVGYPRGISGVIGRDLFAQDALQNREHGSAKSPRAPLGIQRFKAIADRQQTPVSPPRPLPLSHSARKEVA